jgi:tetratricopeptide (TPR) repeat protein
MEHAHPVRSRPGSRARPLAFLSILLALLIVTVWNLTRSEALADAERAYARVDLTGCLQNALDHLNRQPWSREAALLAARSLTRLDYADQAESYYRRAGRLSLQDQQVRAYGLVRGPHPEQAIPAYREILRLAPGNVTAMRRLAAVLLARNDKAQLLDLADQLARVPNGEVIGATLRGTVYHNDKNPHLAVEAFERVLELDPELGQMPASRAFLWKQLADDLVECGRLEDAAKFLNQALALAPDPDLLNMLGRTHLLLREFDEAERCFRQAAELAPNDYASHLNLAELALQRRRQDEALQELNQARLLAPRHYGVLYTLGLLYRQLGLTAEANRVQVEINELREDTAASPHTPNPTWPRYAL